jgi:signal recognition particle GTPase
MILNVLVKNQEATEKQRKAFQYIGKLENNNEGNEITLVDKEKRVASGSGSTQTTINQLLKKDLREEACR